MIAHVYIWHLIFSIQVFLLLCAILPYENTWVINLIGNWALGLSISVWIQCLKNLGSEAYSGVIKSSWWTFTHWHVSSFGSSSQCILVLRFWATCLVKMRESHLVLGWPLLRQKCLPRAMTPTGNCGTCNYFEIKEDKFKWLKGKFSCVPDLQEQIVKHTAFTRTTFTSIKTRKKKKIEESEFPKRKQGSMLSYKLFILKVIKKSTEKHF